MHQERDATTFVLLSVKSDAAVVRCTDVAFMKCTVRASYKWKLIYRIFTFLILCPAAEFPSPSHKERLKSFYIFESIKQKR